MSEECHEAITGFLRNDSVTLRAGFCGHVLVQHLLERCRHPNVTARKFMDNRAYGALPIDSRVDYYLW